MDLMNLQHGVVRAGVACPHRGSIRSAQRSLLPSPPGSPPDPQKTPRPPAGLCRAPPARSPVSQVLSR
ncbi:unnamed protein product [Danaus chrysippus]|uniref:(African queen) hypothetical protein n=1 Tax=Danaus chrysippus TaxID=151541 RepID=A0A8J2W1L6_9NEOP|nr:unnamed protein product [Danaus chrysippus]